MRDKQIMITKKRRYVFGNLKINEVKVFRQTSKSKWRNKWNWTTGNLSKQFWIVVEVQEFAKKEKLLTQNFVYRIKNLSVVIQ